MTPPFSVEPTLLKSARSDARHVPSPTPSRSSSDVATLDCLGEVNAEIGRQFAEREIIPLLPADHAFEPKHSSFTLA
jgi:hypothetical protein